MGPAYKPPMTSKLTLAVLTLAFAVVSFDCGSPTAKPDAGSGGGTGTGGGSGARTCDAAPAFVAADLDGKAGYDPGTATSPPYNYATLARASATAGRLDVSFNELYVNAPSAAVNIPAKTYTLCDYCFIIQTNCNSMGGSCAKAYLAQSGSLTVTAATKNVDAGSYAFTLTNATYEEWDFNADVAVDGGCLTLGSLDFAGSWP